MLLFGLLARLQELHFVGAAVSGVQDGDLQQFGPVVGVALDVRGEEHRQPSSVGRHDIDRDSVEIATHLQQWSEMCVVQNASADCQEIDERLAA